MNGLSPVSDCGPEILYLSTRSLMFARFLEPIPAYCSIL